MTVATPIDLSQLPVPSVLEVIDFETLYAERKARLVALTPAEDQAELSVTLALESEPISMLLQENAYREMLLRQRVNDGARAVMLPYAVDGDLDNLVAFYGLTRQVIVPADPDNNIDQVDEGNSDLRKRALLAPLGFSVAGPTDSYTSHAVNAHPNVRDVSVKSPVFSVLTLEPELAALLPANAVILQCDDAVGQPNPVPGMVVVTVLSRAGDGTADQALLDAVLGALSAETVRPTTDYVVAQSATILPYTVRAKLYFFPGPDKSVVMAEAKARLQVYVDECRQLGREVAYSGIAAALHIAGVERVEVIEPAATITPTITEATYCTGIDVSAG